MFYPSSSHYFLSESPQGLLSCVCTLDIKNTKSNFSSTYSLYMHWRETLSTDYSSVHSGLWPHSTQWVIWNVRVAYKLLGVWGILINPPSLGSGLSPLYLLYRRILPSSRLSLLDMTFVLWRWLSWPGLMNLTLRIPSFWKT